MDEPSPHETSDQYALLRAASRNDLAYVKQLLTISHLPAAEENALERAAEKEHSAIVTALIDNGIKNRPKSALKRAIQQSRFATIYALRAHGISIDYSIWQMAFRKSPEMVAALLTGSLDQTSLAECYNCLRDTVVCTRLDPTFVRLVLIAAKKPLCALAFAGNDEFVAENISLGDALLWATLGKQRAIIQKILASAPAIATGNLPFENIKQALLTAAAIGDQAIIKDLLFHIHIWAQISPENIAETKKLINDALFKATEYNQTETIEQLIHHGAQFGEFNKKNMEDLAAVTNAKTTAILQKHGYDIFAHPEPMRLLQSAVRHGNASMVRTCIARSIDINTPNSISMLGIAARNGHIEVVRELLKNGATDIETSVSWAIEFNQTAVVQEFLASGVLNRAELQEVRQNAEIYLKITEERNEAGYESDPGTPSGHWSPMWR